MPAATPAPALPDVRPIHSLLRRTRFLLRSSWGTTGLGLTAGMALTVLVAVTVIDMLAPLVGPWFRLSGLVLLAVPTAWVFLVGVVLPLLRRLGPVELARRVEARIPGMHSRLVSCVDLSRRGGQQSSPAFYRRLVDESLERIGTYRAASIVDWKSVRKALLFAAAAAAVFVGLWIGFGDRLPTALARVFQPFADIPPASHVRYDVSPGTTKLLAGEDVTFAALISKGEPESLTLELYSPNAGVKPIVRPLDKADRNWVRLLSGLNGEKGFEKNFSYRIFGGGTWSRLQHITWIERPVLIDTAVAVHYPAYMAIPEPKVNAPRVRDVTGPESGEVEVIAEAEGQVATAEVEVLETRVRRVPNPNLKQRVWLDRDLPKGALPDGAWQWRSTSAGRGREHANPPGNGLESHGFNNATDPFPVAKGEVLFAYVFLNPLDPPTSIGLQWIDEVGNGDHMAKWGEDPTDANVPAIPGLHRMGPLPKLGEWVRLEVPAALAGLEGKALRGMSFRQYGGKVSWHQSGASQPSFREESETVVAGNFPLRQSDEHHWSGRFPLKGTGSYRVRLKNELGYASKDDATNPKYTAIPDEPPEIDLGHREDLVLSQPQKVPLQATARDDFGLLNVWLAIQREGEVEFRRVKALRDYATPNPLRNEALVGSLDLNELGMKLGDTIRFRLEVRDRKPDREPVKSKDFAIRIVADPNAADKQLEAFEKNQDPFREKLLKLIGEQAKVRDKIEQTAAKYEALNRKVQDAVAEAEAHKPKAEPGKPEPKAPDPLKVAKLDPQDLKDLEALRRQLNELFQQETQNTQLAQQAAQDLANTVQQAERMPLLNSEIAQGLKDLQESFNRAAMNPLQDLAQRFQQGAQPQQTPPDLKDLKRRGDRVQAALEALKQRAEALANAQKGVKSDAQAALEKLREEMLRERGNLTAQELKELKEFLEQLREELARMQGKQQDLADQTDKAPDPALPEIERKQLTLEELLKRDLEDAKRVLERERARRMKKPNLPDEPFSGDPKERKGPPTEEDDPNSDPTKKKDATDPNQLADPKKAEKKDGDEKEDLFMPALGGEKEKTDPRYANKRRPSPKKDGSPDDPHARRESLRDQQDENMENLDAAQKALKSDANALERMMRDLLSESQKASRGGKPMGQGDEASQALQQLQKMLQSEAMQQARAMAQRARQGRQGQQQASNQPNQAPAQQSSLNGNQQSGVQGADLGEFTLQERTMILQLPPRVREELLQGMREEGPEGYRKFIQDYFKRLSQTQPQPK